MASPPATGRDTDNERHSAHYELAAPPNEPRADMPLLLRVRVRNTGAVAWPNEGPHPINLSYHWFDTHGQMVEFEGLRMGLPAPLEPGAWAEIELWVEPPQQAGEYHLAVDMVEEGVGWFSLQGAAPLSIPLVVAPARQAPRVCIIGPLCIVKDAVSNHMLNQAHFFLARGYQPLILVEQVGWRQPTELREYMLALTYADVVSGHVTPLNRRALEFFRSADMYIFHFPLPYPLFEAIAHVERGVVVFDYHGVTPPQLWDGAGREEFLRWYRRQMGLVRYADYAVAHSGFTREELLRTGAIAAERVSQMPYAVPLDRFRPGDPDPDLLARYGLQAHQPILLYVGRMATNKRIIDLVRALPPIRQIFPQAALLLVGDNVLPPYVPVMEEAQQEAAALGVEEGVIFAGQVADEELPAHYQLADVFVIASIHEGFCIPVLEAMACGVPVVGAHATALPETIGDAGLTFRPQDPADLAAKVIEVLGLRTEIREPLPDKMTR